MTQRRSQLVRLKYFPLFLVLLCGFGTAHGHEVRPAYLHIKEVSNGDATAAAYEVLWKQPIVQNRRLPIEPVFGEDCPMAEILAPQITNGALIHHWRTDCDLPNIPIHIDGLARTLTDVMVRIDLLSGESNNYILRPENPTLDLASGDTANLSYFVIGVEHLVFGIDHVLFVVGLFLFIRSPLALIKTITAFTVAHSITLALSVLGIVTLKQGPIEAIIALSILFLARELVVDEARRSSFTNASPWIMAFAFGLLHGLGFAGALAEIGLPDDTLWLALLLFNVGLEAGQLLVIALMAVLMWLLRKIGSDAQLTRYAAYAMGCVAAFWTIDRTLLLI